ncbi:hypothetical protein Pryu01_01567 [Paraliobacillus ryukyuensis]|uniref:Uncharacterized protein YybS (DUF2232 family) n=1 Tax=Paraliobacillus ryukyuensis TaxID=200904 RepID=A0A366EBX2_9BACI|nr:YybS family protein [Paraliobacillus ryukyuensis]RBO99910.1 uncharacterized protein YybS (DUF2232 family) [Paraliobacillus ryukyuensis]
MQDKQKLKAAITTGLIYVLLLAVTILIPASEWITLFLLPIPFVSYTSRYGLRDSLSLGGLVLVIAVLLTLFVFVVTLPFTLLAVLTGTLIGYSIHHKRHAYETWALGTVGVSIGLVTLFVLIQGISQVDLIAEYETMVEESIKTSQAIMGSTGVSVSQEDLNTLRDQFLQFIKLLPTLLIAAAIGIAFVTQWLSYKWLNWRGNRNLAFPPFRTFKLPKSVIWIFLIAIVCSWFSDPTSAFATGVLNVTNIIGILLTLQGVSFLFFYFYQKRISKAVPILIVIFGIIFLPVGLYMTRILGIIDVGMDLRERMKQTK